MKSHGLLFALHGIPPQLLSLFVCTFSMDEFRMLWLPGATHRKEWHKIAAWDGHPLFRYKRDEGQVESLVKRLTVDADLLCFCADFCRQQGLAVRHRKDMILTKC